MGVGKSGASNAAVLAAEILARSDAGLSERLHEYKKRLADGVERRDRELRKARDV
jgi:5-(carboxyamino)imidazole ribonucleotide mutase